MTKSVMNLSALVKAEDSEMPGHNERDPDGAAQDEEQVIRYEFDRKFLFRCEVDDLLMHVGALNSSRFSRDR